MSISVGVEVNVGAAGGTRVTVGLVVAVLKMNMATDGIFDVGVGYTPQREGVRPHEANNMAAMHVAIT